MYKNAPLVRSVHFKLNGMPVLLEESMGAPLRHLLQMESIYEMEMTQCCYDKYTNVFPWYVKMDRLLDRGGNVRELRWHAGRGPKPAEMSDDYVDVLQVPRMARESLRLLNCKCFPDKWSLTFFSRFGDVFALSQLTHLKLWYYHESGVGNLDAGPLMGALFQAAPCLEVLHIEYYVVSFEEVNQPLSGVSYSSLLTSGTCLRYLCIGLSCTKSSANGSLFTAVVWPADRETLRIVRCGESQSNRMVPFLHPEKQITGNVELLDQADPSVFAPGVSMGNSVN